jgi:S-adenosylmethionine:tRNA-ribosyltransferase-isomerase (queuine synthetase)
MMMTRPAVFIMLPSAFHFKDVLLTNAHFSRSSLNAAMMCVEAVTCIRSDSVKNRSSVFLSTGAFPFIHRQPKKGPSQRKP